MMTLKLISKRRTQKYNYLKYTFVTCLLILIISVLFWQCEGYVNLILIIVLVLSGASLGYVKQHIHIGHISFSNDEIKINNSSKLKFQLKDLKNVKLTIHSYKNQESLATMFGVSGGLTGLGNYVEFISLDGIKFRYEFFIETKGQKQTLEDVYHFWKKMFSSSFKPTLGVE